jgi:cytochrome c553
MLDAYTLRKTLPRIIIVAIAITISWPLLEFLVQLSNFLGDALRGILLSPFSSLGGTFSQGFESFVGGSAVLGGAALVGLGSLGSLTFVLVALISLLVAFFTLVVRQILLVLLVIISPLAIVAYLLPNTERFFKMWRKTLTSVLIVFPIITLFLTTGEIFSKIALNGHPSALDQVVAIVAYFIPYLLLPTAFKLAGDVMGALHGAALNRTGGMRKSLTGYRAKERQKHLNELKTGQRLQGRLGQTSLGKRFNNRTARIATGSRGHFGIGARGDAAMADESAVAAAEILKDPRFQQLGLNDNAVGLSALSGGSERRARDVAKQLGLSDDETEKAINAIKASGGFSAVRSQAAMSLFAQNKARLKGFQDHANPYSLVEQAAEEASSGNQERKEAMLNNFSFVARQSGIPFVSNNSSPTGALSSYSRLDVQQVASMQPKSVQRYISSFKDILNNPTNYSREQVISAAKGLREIATIHSGTPESKQYISDLLNNTPDVSTGLTGVVKKVSSVIGPSGVREPSLDDWLLNQINASTPTGPLYTTKDLQKDTRSFMGMNQ